MCTRWKIWLACDHFDIRTDCCSAKTGIGIEDCKHYRLRTVEYPPPAGFQLPRFCPLMPNCPYSIRSGAWNCCECGKVMNTGGRCECVMIHGGVEIVCGHFCCHACPKGSYQL
ncbi:hypothetical protein TOPH_05981 [Tolypocladium ophioglossoides CBS 100239]|uniref:Uncharacterized protein n=1 Tax=Tolypocladium ophioglossoides (strain CBS 100239) TaxID=1163406 RepID=A0A0L0N5G6_TOLOC|nr:hypothetical protein TOPH_05981 [Tolypocladium ophioglossoides CBS 100239]